MATPNTGLLARMNELMLKYCLPIEGQQPTSTDTASDEWVLAVINSWGPYVHLLGHKIFQQNLINALLKIPEVPIFSFSLLIEIKIDNGTIISEHSCIQMQPFG